MPDTSVAQAAARHYIGFQSNLNPNEEVGCIMVWSVQQTNAGPSFEQQ